MLPQSQAIVVLDEFNLLQSEKGLVKSVESHRKIEGESEESRTRFRGMPKQGALQQNYSS